MLRKHLAFAFEPQKPDAWRLGSRRNFTANSGAPLTIRAGADLSLNGQNLDTADVAGNWQVNQSRSRLQEWAMRAST